MRVLEEITYKTEELIYNGIKPEILIIGFEKMALFSSEETYIKNWIIPATITSINIHGYKLKMFIDQDNKRELEIYGKQRELTTF